MSADLADNDITIPHFTTVLSVVDDTLIARGQGKGLKLYDEIERDTHAYAVLQKRKFALVGREWVIEPASESAIDKKAAAFVEEQLKRLPFDQMCLDLLDATLKGYSVAEIVWMRAGNAIVPERIVAHDPRRFVFDEAKQSSGEFWSPRLVTLDAPLKGIELPERKFVVHRFGVKGNNPYGLGLGSKLFWPVLFKREGVAFWLTFLEKFASPTPVGKYPMGMLPDDQRKLLGSLEEMRQAGAIVVPMGTDVSFLEATRSGTVRYEDWCKYWDTQMALCVFGSTLATYVEGQGSRAASETHKEAEEQIIDADADLLSDTLRRSLFRWIVDYNIPGAEPPAIRRIRPKNEALHEDLRKKRAENMKAELDHLFNLASRVPPENFADLAAALAGVDLMPQVPLEVLRKLSPHLASARLNLISAARAGQLPMPENDPKAEQLREIAFAGHDSPARVRGVVAEENLHDHGMMQLAAQLGDMSEPMLTEWLDHIRGELDASIARGESYEDFSARLSGLYGDMTIDPLGNVIAAAITVGELTGRDDVAAELKAKKKGRK